VIHLFLSIRKRYLSLSLIVPLTVRNLYLLATPIIYVYSILYVIYYIYYMHYIYTYIDIYKFRR